jgi:NAD(P)-dependent dehydrogenase (short-subunit alcohol dehydrogenase family)
MDIAGSVALIAGGAAGLGRATAEALTARGAAVVVFDLPNAESAVAVDSGPHFAAGDVRDADAVQAAVDLAAGLGPLRIVVNCAGVGAPGRIVRKGEPMPLEHFKSIVDINLIGTFNVCRLAAARMVANELSDGDRGVIVNTASIAAYDGQIGQVAYAASKGGIASLTLPLARDLAQYAVRCVTIAPGIFDTALLGTLSEEVRASLGAAVPHPARLGSPPEYAQLAVQIIENPMLNGEVIRLDGALRMAPR